MLLDSLPKTFVIDGALTGTLDLGFHFIFITTALIAVVTSKEWYHRAYLYVSYVLVLT
jgi:predicted ABC-type sugar transport system permease subunit